MARAGHWLGPDGPSLQRAKPRALLATRRCRAAHSIQIGAELILVGRRENSSAFWPGTPHPDRGECMVFCGWSSQQIIWKVLRWA